MAEAPRARPAPRDLASRACGTRMKMVTFDTMMTAVTHSVVMKPCEWVVVT